MGEIKSFIWEHKLTTKILMPNHNNMIASSYGFINTFVYNVNVVNKNVPNFHMFTIPNVFK